MIATFLVQPHPVALFLFVFPHQNETVGKNRALTVKGLLRNRNFDLLGWTLMETLKSEPQTLNMLKPLMPSNLKPGNTRPTSRKTLQAT